MRVVPLSHCERDFIDSGFEHNVRLDGRSCEEFRQVGLTLGTDDGSCFVSLGNTKVLARVTVELGAPKPRRPNEGVLNVSVDMSPMAAANFEAGRLGERGVQLSRLLERALRESGCVDLESLCVRAPTLAWLVRVRLTVMDDDGGLVDAASVAAAAALLHARRPDVRVDGRAATLVSADERPLVPLNLYHLPICVSFGYSELSGGALCRVADPTERERLAVNGAVVVGANKRHEICLVHCGGSLGFDRQQIQTCCNRAIERATELTEQIRAVIAADADARSKAQPAGFASLIETALLTSSERIDRTFDVFRQQPTKSADASHVCAVSPTLEPSAVRESASAAHIGDNSPPLMTEREDDDVEIIAEISAVAKPPPPPSPTQQPKRPSVAKAKATANRPRQKSLEDVTDLLDEIEEDVILLEPSDFGFQKPTSDEVKVVSEDIDLTTAVKSKASRKKKSKQ